MDWEDYAPLVLCLIFAGSAAFSLAVAVWSLRWPSVKGRVVVSFLDKESEWTSTAGKSTTFYKRESESHCLAYEYEVGGVKFLGANVKPWGDSDWTVRAGGGEVAESGRILWSGARDTAQWYRPDTVVDVYYCPWRPQWACLEPGGFVIPLLLGAIAVATYLFLVR